MTREEKIKKIIKNTDKNYSPYYSFLPKLIKERGYKQGIEIGVFAGGHAKAILENSDLNLLVGIDPYKIYKPGMPKIDTQEDFDCLYTLVKKRLDPKRYIHLREESDKAIYHPLFQNNQFDFVFIDGYHSYNQLKKDLANYSQLIRHGGVIACHDYHHPNFPDLTKAIDEFAEQYKTKVIECPLHAIYMEWL